MKTIIFKKKSQKIAVIFLAAIFSFLLSCETKHERTFSQENNDFKFLEADIAQLRQGYEDGSFSITEVIQAYIERIDNIDKSGPSLNSIITVNPDALTIAAKLDEELQKGITRGPLHGIPVVLKDNIDTHDKMPTTAGSLALANSYPLHDSHIAKILRKAGAVIIGKANLSEWANFRGELSTSGWSGVGGQTKNPYVLSRNPCGSSSGSAVAVSANLTVLAIGTETNGSIVCPSHANGIVGIKPTVGLVSRYGVVPISYTQDSPGPMARSVRDVAICLGALTGVDPLDKKTLDSDEYFYLNYTQFLKEDGLKGKRIGFFKAPLGNNFKVDSLMSQAVDIIKNLGAEVVELERITQPNTAYYSFEVMLYEYKDGLNNYFQSLGPEAPIKNVEELIAFNKEDSIELKHFNQRYLELAQEKDDLNSKEYKDALEKMLKGSREEGIDKVMDEHNLDAIMAPTGSPAWLTDLINGDSFQLGSSSPSAQAGYPIITLPMGFIEGLPVGISFFSTAWSEPVLFEIAYSFESATKHRKVPAFTVAE